MSEAQQALPPQSTNYFEELSVEKRRSFLVYGYPGCGKTYMLKTAVAGTNDRMVIFDFKGGLNTISDLVGAKTKEGRPQVRVARLHTFESIMSAIGQLYRAVEAGLIQWVVVDNGTDMSSMIMRGIRSAMAEGEVDQKAIMKLGMKKNLGEYGWCIQRCGEIVDAILTLNANIVFTAWVKRLDSGLYSPRAETESIGEMLAGACDHVFFLNVRPVDDMVVDATRPSALVRQIFTASGEHMARTRGGKLPPVMDPDFRQVIKILTENGL